MTGTSPDIPARGVYIYISSVAIPVPAFPLRWTFVHVSAVKYAVLLQQYLPVLLLQYECRAIQFCDALYVVTALFNISVWKTSRAS